MYLGDESFAQRMQALAKPDRQLHKQIPRQQRMPDRPWSAWLEICNGDRPKALARAYREGGMTMTRLAQDTGLSITHISRLVAVGERG